MEKKNSEEPLMTIENKDQIVFLDESGEVTYKNVSSLLTLTMSKLIIENNVKKTIEKEILLNGLIGVTIDNEGKDAGRKLLLHFFAYPPSGCCSSTTKRKQSTMELIFTYEQLCQNWMNAINSQLRELPISRTNPDGIVLAPSKRRYLVFVNPVGGTGNAVKIWNRIRLFLTKASIDYDLLITERANHAKDVMTTRDLTDINAVVLVGGDGLIFEVVSGLMARSDSETQLQRLIFAPIPGGSGNGLIKSILHESGEEYSPENAIFVAIRGKPSPLDLSLVQTRNHSHVSFLILGWGFISDCDILSEGMRWMGEMRFTVAAVYRLGIKKLYPGKLSILLQSPPSDTAGSSATPVSSTSTHSKKPILPPISEPLDTSSGNWLVIEDEFILVWVLQTSHCSSSMYSCPGASLNDGVLTILVVRNISRCALLTMLLDIDQGDHMKHPQVEIYKAQAYRLEPQIEEGLFSLDGEVVEYGPIQGEVQPGAMKVFTLPHEETS